MAQAKGDRQAGKKSVEDNFDEMLKVFEGDADLQGQICESSTSVSFFIYMYYGYCLLYLCTLKKHGLPIAIAIASSFHLDAIPTFIATKLTS